MIRNLIAVFVLFAGLVRAGDLAGFALFPADWQGNSYAFLEDFPHPLALKLRANGKALAEKTARVTVETPDFLDLEAATLDRGWRGRTDLLKLASHTENGKRFYSFALPRSVRKGLNPKSVVWGSGHNLFFRARKGSAGKSGTLVIRFGVPGGEELRKKYQVTVLRQPRFPAEPLKRFTVGITRQTARGISGLKYLQEATTFWQHFNARPLTTVGWAQFNAYPEVRDHLKRNYTLYTGNFACRDSTPKFPATNFRDLGFLVNGKVTRPGVPLFVDDKGKTVDNAVCPLYLIQDPEGLFWGDYYRRSIQKTLDLFPECTMLDFDYEPFPHLGTCSHCLAEFARFANLKQTPKRSEIAAGRPLNPKWRAFKLMLHRRILEKHVEACRRHFPERKITLCMEMPRGRDLSNWIGSTTIGKTDGYTPMNYTSGAGYFDDLALQRRILGSKAFILSMVDPAEENERFFRRYTPERLAQNAVATAALGAQGFIVYPSDILDGRTLACLSESFAAIQEAEEVYFQGKEGTPLLKVTPVNTVDARVEDEKGDPVTIKMPDFLPGLRRKMHRLGGSYAVTLLNYTGREVFLRVAIPTFAGKGPAAVRDAFADERFTGLSADNIRQGFLVRIPIDGVRVLCIGGPASGKGAEVTQYAVARQLEVSRKQLEEFRTVYQPRQEGTASLKWIQVRGGKIVAKLGLGEQYVIIEPEKAELTAWRNGRWHPFGGPGAFLGRVRFFSLAAQGEQEYQADGSLLGPDAASISFLHTVPKDAGFGEENPLAGLQVRKTFRLLPGDEKHGTLEIVTEMINPTSSAKTVGFRLGNAPLAGYKPPEPPYKVCLNGAEVTPGTVSCRPGRAINWEAGGVRREYTGEMRIEAAAPYYLYQAVCPDADGFYSWASPVLHTAEFLFSDMILPPGGRRAIRQTWNFTRSR